jgi:hypothetical protein
MARSVFHAPIPRTNLGLIRRGGRATATDARASARTPSGQSIHCCIGLAASGAVRRRGRSWPAPADVRADGLAATQGCAPSSSADLGMLCPRRHRRRARAGGARIGRRPPARPRRSRARDSDPCLIIIICRPSRTHEISPPARGMSNGGPCGSAGAAGRRATLAVQRRALGRRRPQHLRVRAGAISHSRYVRSGSCIARSTRRRRDRQCAAACLQAVRLVVGCSARARGTARRRADARPATRGPAS